MLTTAELVPTDDMIVEELMLLRSLHPESGVNSLVRELHATQPSWKFNVKRFKSLLKKTREITIPSSPTR